MYLSNALKSVSKSNKRKSIFAQGKLRRIKVSSSQTIFFFNFSSLRQNFLYLFPRQPAKDFQGATRSGGRVVEPLLTFTWRTGLPLRIPIAMVVGNKRTFDDTVE